MMITISGKAGSGKSTIAELLAKKLGYIHVNIGHMRRELAQQMGLTIIEFDELGNRPENKEKFDLKYEEYQQSLDVHDGIVLDGWMSCYCQPEAFNVFLTVSDEEAGRRIFEDQTRKEEHYASQEEVFEETKRRTAESVDRYKKLYNFDILDESHYDFVVDTSGNHPDIVVDGIIAKFQEFQKSH